jgi:DNA-directed RNA polymerase II subunit RPB1
MIKYDGTVRNANDTVIQFVYGDSGANPVSQFEYEIGALEMNNEQLERNYKFTSQELANFSGFSQKENDDFYNNIKSLRDEIRIRVQRAKLDYMTRGIAFMIPVNLARIVEDLKESKSSKSNLSPKYIIDKINNVLTSYGTPLIPMSKKEREDPNSFKNLDEQAHKTVFRLALYNALAPKKLLLEYGMDKETFDKTIENISTSFEKNIVEPGEAVGVLAAAATGEPLTQMNLNSFHQSGVARMNAATQGVPRMREVFSVTKNLRTPQMFIYLTEDIRSKKDIARKIASNLKHTTFGEIRERINVYYEPNATIDSGLSEQDNIIPMAFSQKNNKANCQTEISTLPWLMRIVINREKMAEKEITLLDIISQFCNWWSSRYADTKSTRKEEKRLLNKITQLAVLSNSDNDKEQIVHIRFNARDNDKDKFDHSTINDFIYHILDKFKLKGINGIKEITAETEEKYVTYDSETGAVKAETDHVIYTSGVNLTEIRYLMGIDLKRTISNDIVQIYNTYGIEIARSILLKEITMAYSTQGGGEVNYQHIEIIVDQMTSSGSINSIDRHGLSKSDADPLARAAFEKPVEQLWNAAVFNESDAIKGVSARIMVGRTIGSGTGACDLLLNVDMIEKNEYIDTGYDKKYSEIRVDTVTNDILSRKDEIDDDTFMPM